MSENRRRSGKHVVICGADFETDHTSDNSRAWVCQWALVRMRDRSSNLAEYAEAHGYDLQSFEVLINQYLHIESTDFVIYFHNLKYDFQFMREFLFRLQEKYQSLGDKEVLLIIRSGKPIIMRFHNIEFRDSANKMPAGTTVQQMGDMIGIPKLESPRGNFNAGWSRDLTDDDFQYVIHDALIVGKMMQTIHQLGRKHATSSGDAWASIRAIYNKHHNHNGYGDWNRHYPTLTQKADDWLRPGYFGGINLSQHVGYNTGIITHEDVNSMYPTVMLYDPLPYGIPHRIQTTPEKEGYQLFVMKAEMKFYLKPGMIPVLKFKYYQDRMIEDMLPTDYVENCWRWHDMTLTNIDLENYSRFYDIEVNRDTVEYVGFDSEVGAHREYIQHWYKIKSDSPKNSVERLSAKLMLNSAYGRFGMSSREDNVRFAWDEDLGDYNVIGEENISDKVPGYLPFAMFVTAHARRRLLDNVLAVGCENVIHCDTDSVIHFGPPSALGHTDALGDWGIESTPEIIYEGGVKRYIELQIIRPEGLDDVTLTCAGVPQKRKDGIPSGMWLELLDDPDAIYDTGRELGQEHYSIRSPWLRELLINAGKDPDDQDTRKLLPKKVPGGVVLIPTTFKLHDMMETRYR